MGNHYLSLPNKNRDHDYALLKLGIIGDENRAIEITVELCCRA